MGNTAGVLVTISPETRQRLKLKALQNHETVSDVQRRLIDVYLEDIPSPLTIAARALIDRVDHMTTFGQMDCPLCNGTLGHLDGCVVEGLREEVGE